MISILSAFQISSHFFFFFAQQQLPKKSTLFCALFIVRNPVREMIDDIGGSQNLTDKFQTGA